MKAVSARAAVALLVLTLACLAGAVRAEVMLQWFETDWDEMYRRLPEAAEIGYGWIWIPPPTKAPTGLGTKWGNVGYSLYDRFDLGDIPQRGSLATRYGTRGSLRAMVDAAHACDIHVIPDIVMNHNGNGPDFRYYPGMVPEDFHVQWEPSHCNTLNYKRGPRMDQWYHGEGYGATMWQDLASLIDIRTEEACPDPGRFTGGSHTPGWNFVSGARFLRHVGQYDKYPYFPAGYTNENAVQMLNRWIAWLGRAMDFDGLRIDAAKHTPWEFFGPRGGGFLHEAQWSFNQRRGFSDGNAEEADTLFANDLLRDDALIFAEILSPWSELEYWFGGGSRNPMRFLDYQVKRTADSALNGNIGAFYGYGTDFGPNNGIMYIWGHDEGPASKATLGYAYILTHIGFPMVYFTGNNILWSEYGRTPDKKTWVVPGYDGQALGDLYNDVPNLVWINQNFARGSERDLWHDGDYLAYERYDAVATRGKSILLVALNDSGSDQQRTLTTQFEDGTILHDYTGNFAENWGFGAGNIRVHDGGQADVKVPGNYGQGWVCFAPLIAENLDVRIEQGGAPAPTMTWIVPGGIHAPEKTRPMTRVTASNFTVDVTFVPPAGGTVDSVMLKWGRGLRLTTNFFSEGTDLVSGRYEALTEVVPNADWKLDVSLTETNVPEGLNLLKVRAFTQRPAGFPALFNTASKVIYVDRRGPDLDIAVPAAGEAVPGECVMVISNADFTAYGMTVAVDSGTPQTAHEIMKGLWKFNLSGLASGMHTAVVTATEADWGSPRTVINTARAERVFAVAENAQPIDLNHADGATRELPFFRTVVTAPGAPDRVRLTWDGYELPFNGGGLTNVFNGEVVFRDHLANVVTDRLWGAFCNGPHFFEAERVDGGVTSRVCRRVHCNLYGINAIDSDGDALPDNVEMPFMDTQGAPGADQPWPGDSNKDFVPNCGEYWPRLNPYNHATYYSGQWDDQNDFDGDGYGNGAELLAGYAEGNIYKYGIYDAGSHPSGVPVTPGAAAWDPVLAVRGAVLNITYTPHSGVLQGVSPVWIHVGHSFKTAGEWQDVLDAPMAPAGDAWTYAYLVPSNATSVEFVFRDPAGALWDNNGGRDWHVNVEGSAARFFTMDGAADGNQYTVFPDAMKILAAVKGDNLYVATWSAGGGGNDHFLYVTDEPGTAQDAPWAKAGKVFCDLAAKPFMAAEGQNGFCTWYNVAGGVANGEGVLEGEFNLADAFGAVPEAVYVAAVACGTGEGGPIYSQGPHTWNSDNNLDVMEFLRIPIASVRDDNLDGYFDAGKPELWTVVEGNTNDANYGLRRLFLDERAGDFVDLTVILRPNTAPGDSVTDTELFSNVNRRDFAKMEEDPGTVTANSVDTYYRAYPMAPLGDGRYAHTLRVTRCGAYRVNARYRVNGGPYVYYTDHGLRRDCAVVVSPKKALETVLYELNPMIAEATNDDFYGRSTFRDMVRANTNRTDVINTNHFAALGVNMVWLQPIHPIGAEGRENDPATGLPYDPGSPYAVRNYWRVSAVLGDPATEAQAMAEFTNFVQALDAAAVGVMLDGTFNHSAWDCEIGEMGVCMGLATNPTARIREVRPQWYSRRDQYGEHATHYESAADNDIGTAPDRFDFGKWSDAADFFFGRYDALVQGQPSDTNTWWPSPWAGRYLFEEDRFEGHDAYTRELWEYFAAYPLYWLEKTGHPGGTPAAESHRGIDGLRCDFAQGLPSPFWEYCINRTRTVKWDFLFMAESLDGFREVGGSKRHGVGYRSARHFDILNENIVFYWRNNFFAYPYQGAGGANWGRTPEPHTFPTWREFDARRNAFDVSPLLLNLTSHDEVYPAHDPYRVLYAYAEVAAMDGVPMLFVGQEAGAQNNADVYNFSGEIPDGNHNFDRYERNFGKSIPHFKRYNSMRRVWAHRDWNLQDLYGRVNRARLSSPALRSQGAYFLSRTDTGQYDPDLFAVAKFEAAGVSAASQEVVLVFVNNNYWGSENRWATFNLNADYNGRNWFGIESGHTYNLVNLIATNPAAYLWSTNKSAAELLSGGITVGLTQPALEGGQAQYLRLTDTAAAYPDLDADGLRDFSDPDDDNDGLPDWWEQANGLNPRDATGDNGPDGDADRDGASNAAEFLAGTAADDGSDRLHIRRITVGSNTAEVVWAAKPSRDYRLERSINLLGGAPAWLPPAGYRTALAEELAATDGLTADASNRYYRIRVR